MIIPIKNPDILPTRHITQDRYTNQICETYVFFIPEILYVADPYKMDQNNKKEYKNNKKQNTKKQIYIYNARMGRAIKSFD